MRITNTLAKLLLFVVVLSGCAWEGDEPRAGQAPTLEESTDGLSLERCAGPRGLTCSKGQFCSALTPGQCPGPNQYGACATRPAACTHLYAPVCGCDGNTYGNSCLAAAAGISVAHRGACVEEGPFCGGIAGIPCEVGSCIDDPSDDCNPSKGGSDCAGICVGGAFCGGIAGIPCEAGSCVDDPSDDCDPKQGGSDCGGICMP